MLLFLTRKSNQLNALTRLLQLLCFLERHPYWPYPKPYGCTKLSRLMFAETPELFNPAIPEGKSEHRQYESHLVTTALDF